MAYANAQTHRTTGWMAAFGDTVSAIGAAWSRSRAFVRTYNELSALNARDLQDLGIQRSMITRMAYEAAYGRDD